MTEREAFEKWWFDAATVEFLEKPASVHDGCLLAWNARAAIEAQRVPDWWQPIESAPKDGTAILLWEAYSTNPYIGWWSAGRWRASHEHVDAEGGWDGAVVVDRLSGENTHWMPLPAAPSAAAPPVAQPAERKPLSELHINQGSADAAADAYEADYWAAQAQAKADQDTKRGALQAVSYYVRDALLRMKSHGIGD